MEQLGLERLLDNCLEGVELSSPKPNKFDALVAALAEYWALDPASISVKALRDQKNYGNRIGEATRASNLARLVLLAESELNVDAVLRAIEGRALTIVPTLIAFGSESGWKVQSVVVSSTGGNPFDMEVPVVQATAQAAVTVEPELLERIATEILSLDGKPLATSVGSMLSTAGDSDAVVLKHVTSANNLQNRIGEGMGRRPPVFVLATTAELAEPAARVVRDAMSKSPTTRAFLITQLAEQLESKEVHRNEARPDVDSTSSASEDEATDPGAPATSEYRRLERVKLMLRYEPRNAQADRLYEENQNVADRPSYPTRTLKYLRGLLTGKKRVFVVLTGDAGHGKTHMCRAILEGGDTSRDVLNTMASDPRGNHEWKVPELSLPLRVIKDLSEINPPESAASRMRELLEQEEKHVVVCANEGRLRDVVSREPAALAVLLDALQLGLERGDTCPPGREDVHVLNLNYQATAAGEGGFLRHVLDHFLNFESAWKVCRTCLAREDCPISKNRNALAISTTSPPKNATRRAALIDLVRIIEEGGQVVTFRHTLQLVAYLITGGLSCADVESLHRKRKLDKLREHELLSLLFEAKLSSDDAEVLAIIERLRRLDPGRVAQRSVDERLHSELETMGELGDGLLGDASRQLHKRTELKKEERAHRILIRQRRRLEWFNSASVDGDGITRSSRLGFAYHDRFRELQNNPEPKYVLSIIRELVKGLHTVQGAVGMESNTRFHLVDPAFGRSGSHASVIARTFKNVDLDLVTESDWWKQLPGAKETPPVLESVEWIDRRVILTDKRSQIPILALDLLAFEFVMSAANGIVMREFHSAERRRILRTLARHAEHKRKDDAEIRVLLEAGEGELTVERDNTIFLGGTQ